jgi:hypothetical protein
MFGPYITPAEHLSFTLSVELGFAAWMYPLSIINDRKDPGGNAR